MVGIIVPIPTAQIVQEDQPHGNLVYSEQEGVLYNPSPDTDEEQDAYFQHNIAPPVNSNFAWNQVKINWTRSYTSTPLVFEALFSLEGILLDGTTELLAENIITSISGSEVTEDIIFDLYSSRSTPAFRKMAGSAAAGKIQLNLPKRWLNYESMVLKRAWLDGWDKRSRIPITGNPTTWKYTEILRGIVVNYDSDMNADFSDIRFCDKDGRTLRCYDREYYSSSSKAIFNVLVPTVVAGATLPIYMYYGNSGASYSAGLTSYYDIYDDFEDGAYSGSRSPYPTWTNEVGTPSLDSSTPISGTYSLKHTGDATTTNYIKTPRGPDQAIHVSLDLKLLSQGSGTNAPYVTFYWNRENSNNHLKAYAYYDGADTRLKVVKVISGTPTDVANVLWLSGSKIPVGTTYHLSIKDTGDHITIKVNGTQYIDTDYTASFSQDFYGVGMNLSGVADFDNFTISYFDPEITIGSLGSEESTLTVDPDTPGEDDTSILYTTPADWTGADPACLESTELEHDVYDTNDIMVTPLDILEYGYNSVDRFVGIILKMYLQADPNCNVRINSASYVYEEI
jgi:hypothetical protein